MMASRYHCGSLRSIMSASQRDRRHEPPDHDRALARIERDPMRLAVEREPVAVEEVLASNGSVVRQAELPERHLVGAFLAVLRIEIHEDEDAIVLLAGQPRIGQDAGRSRR